MEKTQKTLLYASLLSVIIKIYFSSLGSFMKNKYLIGMCKNLLRCGDLRIVCASSEEEAKGIYLEKYGIVEEEFKYYYYGKVANECFCSMFWFKTVQESVQFDLYGNIVASVNDFKKRVFDFFGEHETYASIYVHEYFKDKKSSMMDCVFPKEMLIYMAKNDPGEVTEAINLSEVKELY